MTGLRSGELHNLRWSDVRPDGTINVRMLHAQDSPTGRGLKGLKPRVAAWVNGMDQSPTLDVVRRYVHGEHRLKGRPVGRGAPGREPDGEARIWPSGESAWKKWVTNRLGPMSGLQRPLPLLNGNPDGPPRYLVHPHAFRACFVMVCRRWPRRLGLEPVPWDAICALGGWEDVATIMRSYYYADMDETLNQLRRSIPVAQAPRTVRREIPWSSTGWGR